MDDYRVAIFRVAEPEKTANPAEATDEKYIALVPSQYGSSQNWSFTSNTLFGLKAKMEDSGVRIVLWETAEVALRTSGFYKQFPKEPK